MKPRAFVLQPITLREANAFVTAHHRHCMATVREGGRIAVGAFVTADGPLVGIGILARPINATLAAARRTAEVARVCTCPEAPPNVCSSIYRALWRAWVAIGGDEIVTYTLAKEHGASLRAAGLVPVAKVRPHQWNRTGRPRKEQRIFNEPKVRWALRAVTKLQEVAA